MQAAPDGKRPPSLYALVIYLPDPLGAFLDDLRRELVPGCNPHAHVSVLPPRTLEGPPEAAVEHAQRTVAGFAPFEIVLGGIEKFDATDVIFIGLEQGEAQLREMYRSLNQGILVFPETYAYHPHVTLAQEIPPEQVESLRALAIRRWSDYRGPRRFRAGKTVFVRNIRGNLWIDMAEAPFEAAPSRAETLE